MSRTLTVMTFNIHHGVGMDGRLDLGRIAALLRSERVDVAGLQEVDRHLSRRSAFADQAGALARELSMDVVFGANVDLDPLGPGLPRRQYGSAILSRWPIQGWGNTLLPCAEGHEQRGVLRARVNVAGTSVQVYCIHLQHDDATARRTQVGVIKDLIGAPVEPVVMLGDFNAVPRSAEIRDLTASLADAWGIGGQGEGTTYPAHRPSVRIDYVMTSKDVVVRSVAVVPADGSDHLPVRAELLLPETAVDARPRE